MGVRYETGAGVDVGVSGGVAGEGGAVTDDGHPTGQVVVGDGAPEGVVDSRGGMSRCDRETEQEKDRR